VVEYLSGPPAFVAHWKPLQEGGPHASPLT